MFYIRCNGTGLLFRTSLLLNAILAEPVNLEAHMPSGPRAPIRIPLSVESDFTRNRRERKPQGRLKSHAKSQSSRQVQDQRVTSPGPREQPVRMGWLARHRLGV